MLGSRVANCFFITLLCCLPLLPDSAYASRKTPDILTDKGEVAIDHETGEKLPEEMDDGELEGGDHHTEWNYNNQHDWSSEYPFCMGKNMRQSPIDIETDNVILDSNMELDFIDWDQEVDMEYKNTHHSVSVTPVSLTNHTPTVRLSWLPNGTVFELQEIHFHWGNGEEKGSEHEINNQKAAAEMHMVHYKKGVKKADIGNVDNSVLVIGVLIESDNVEHNKLEGLVSKTTFVNGTDDEYKSDSPEFLINLLPDYHNSFYTYNGSLTTPPCYEVVTWVVMSSPVYMDNDRLIELSTLEAKTKDGTRKMNSNHRDVQPLLNRPVYTSFNTTDSVTPGIGDSRFGASFDNYWGTIDSIRNSVSNAYDSAVNEAESGWSSFLSDVEWLFPW